MVLYFVSRADRYLKELRELVPTSPPTSLRDVRRDRGTRSAQLRRQSECLKPGKSARGSVDIDRQYVSLLPYFQPLEVLHIPLLKVCTFESYSGPHDWHP